MEKHVSDVNEGSSSALTGGEEDEAPPANGSDESELTDLSGNEDQPRRSKRRSKGVGGRVAQFERAEEAITRPSTVRSSSVIDEDMLDEDFGSERQPEKKFQVSLHSRPVALFELIPIPIRNVGRKQIC